MVCTGTLLNQISPLPAGSSPDRQRSRVVLPLPRGPPTARISLSRTPSETPLSPGESSSCRKCRARAQSTSLSGGATMAYTSVRIGNAVRDSGKSPVRGNEGAADRSLAR